MAKLLTISATVLMPEGATGGTVEIIYPTAYRVAAQFAGGMFTGKVGPVDGTTGFAPLLNSANGPLKVFGGVLNDLVPPLVTVKVNFTGGPTFSALPLIYRGHPHETPADSGKWDLSAVGDTGDGDVITTQTQRLAVDAATTAANAAATAAGAAAANANAAATAIKATGLVALALPRGVRLAAFGPATITPTLRNVTFLGTRTVLRLEVPL